MVRAVALRLDRLLLDTRTIELAFVRDMCAVMNEFAGVSPACVIEQLRLVNQADLEGTRFAPHRWEILAEALRVRIAFQVGPDPELKKRLSEAARLAQHAIPQATVHADLMVETIRKQGVRVFGFSYGDTVKYQGALSQWKGSKDLTDVLLQSEPGIDGWTSFWQDHGCDTSTDESVADPMVVFTPDPFYDPPLSFRLGSPVVLVGTKAQGGELPAVDGALEVLAVLSNLDALK